MLPYFTQKSERVEATVTNVAALRVVEKSSAVTVLLILLAVSVGLVLSAPEPFLSELSSSVLLESFSTVLESLMLELLPSPAAQPLLEQVGAY